MSTDIASDETDVHVIEPLLTRRELHKLLKVSSRTISRWIGTGVLPRPHRLGGVDRWCAEDIRRLLET